MFAANDQHFFVSHFFAKRFIRPERGASGHVLFLLCFIHQTQLHKI